MKKVLTCLAILSFGLTTIKAQEITRETNEYDNGESGRIGLASDDSGNAYYFRTNRTTMAPNSYNTNVYIFHKDSSSGAPRKLFNLNTSLNYSQINGIDALPTGEYVGVCGGQTTGSGQKLWVNVSDSLGNTHYQYISNATTGTSVGYAFQFIDKDNYLVAANYLSYPRKGILMKLAVGASKSRTVTFQSNNGTVFIRGMERISSNVTYVCGTYSGVLNKPGLDTNNTGVSSFIMQINDDLNTQWIKSLGEEGDDILVTEIHADDNGIYLVGTINSSSPITIDNVTLEGNGNPTGFYLKLDLQGNALHGDVFTSTSSCYGQKVLPISSCGGFILQYRFIESMVVGADTITGNTAQFNGMLLKMSETGNVISKLPIQSMDTGSVAQFNGITAGTDDKSVIALCEYVGGADIGNHNLPYVNQADPAYTTQSIVDINWNQKPGPVTISNNSVSSGATSGTVVGELSTEDCDDEQHTYTLVSGAGDSDNGSFTIQGNEVTTNGTVTPGANMQIRVRSTDASGAFVEEVFTVNVENMIGLSDGNLTQETIQLYPNPTTGLITLQIDEPVKSIQLIDLQGANVSLDPKAKQFDLSDLSRGMYVMSIETHSGYQTHHKIILK